MNVLSFIFYFFEIVAAVSAISMIFIRHVFYAALVLIVCLLALAGIYVLAFAEFIAVTQILIYAGGILVIIIFGIMLTSKTLGKPMIVEHSHLFGGSIAGLSFLTMLIYFISKQSFTPPTHVTTLAKDNMNTIGIGLMSDFMLPFEVAGVMLLIALIGAAVIASSIKSKKI